MTPLRPNLPRWPLPPTRTPATRPRHEGRRLDRATGAEPAPGPDRRHHHLAVPAARGADRLAAVLDRRGVHRHAPVLEGPGLAALAADVAVRSGAPVQPLHAQRGRAGAGAHRARTGGYRLRIDRKSTRAAGATEPDRRARPRNQPRAYGKHPQLKPADHTNVHKPILQITY